MLVHEEDETEVSRINYFIYCVTCNYYSCVFGKRNYRVLVRVCVCVSVFCTITQKKSI